MLAHRHFIVAGIQHRNAAALFHCGHCFSSSSSSETPKQSEEGNNQVEQVQEQQQEQSNKTKLMEEKELLQLKENDDNLRQFSQKIKERFDIFQETKAVEVSKYWPVNAQEWEALRKDYDNQRRDFQRTLELQKPKLYKPSKWERRLLYWSGMYTNPSEIPEMVNSYIVQAHRKSMVRRALFLLIGIYCFLHFIWRCDETEL